MIRKVGWDRGDPSEPQPSDSAFPALAPQNHPERPDQDHRGKLHTRKTRKQTTAKDNKSQTGKQNKGHTNREKPPTRTFRPLRWLWGGLLAAVAIVGFVYQFRPEINVDRDVSLNVRDPFATQFRVTNEGRLAVYDLS